MTPPGCIWAGITPFTKRQNVNYSRDNTRIKLLSTTNQSPATIGGRTIYCTCTPLFSGTTRKLRYCYSIRFLLSALHTTRPRWNLVGISKFNQKSFGFNTVRRSGRFSRKTDPFTAIRKRFAATRECGKYLGGYFRFFVSRRRRKSI